MKILIVKTSSLGDIIQSFPVLEDLKSRFENLEIDWAVESRFAPIVSAHPLVRKTISLDIKGRKNLFSGFRKLRKEKYDLVFDLQGNCKSGLVTLCARGKTKVGFGLKSVREWPNVLSTNIRFNVSKSINICSFYLELINLYFGSKSNFQRKKGIRFSLDPIEIKKLEEIVSTFKSDIKIMVCLGSKWENKKIKLKTLIGLLTHVEGQYDSSYYFAWGDSREKDECVEISTHLKKSFVLDKLSVATWQNLMAEMDLVICVDSSALHLCATTLTPSFSVFGPTSPDVFKPVGEHHLAIQGSCPYGKQFEKQCPILRSCPTGACIKDLSVEHLFLRLQKLLK